jgi:hypothetical protein
MGWLIALTHECAIDIGGMPILIRTESAEFAQVLENRYGSFVNPTGPRPVFELEVELVPAAVADPDQDVEVKLESGRWIMERGDFHAEWDTERRRGWIRQTLNPYSIDAVLRILHSLILAEEGGFLVHAASAVKNGRAFLFMGVSGAGKTTISRLAPSDVAVLTDEISYMRPGRRGYEAFGTPFAGELARIGANLRAQLEAVYLLVQGPENKIEAVSESEALQAFLRNVLFFAHDRELVEKVFRNAFDFISRIPVYRLTFVPDAKVWDLIGGDEGSILPNAKNQSKN